MKVAVGLFAKPLIPGTVKTRLTPPLSPEEATALYRAFLTDTALVCAHKPEWTFYVFSPDPESQKATWPQAAPTPTAFRLQRGVNLGERLHNAFLEMFADGHTPALIVGSDHPTLPPSRLVDALTKIQWGDVVLGPSLDGGYYLMGLTQPPDPRLLADIPWSTPQVLEATLKHVAQAGLRGRLLHPWYDVDTPEDLIFLAEDLGLGGHAATPATTATAQALQACSRILEI